MFQNNFRKFEFSETKAYLQWILVFSVTFFIIIVISFFKEIETGKMYWIVGYVGLVSLCCGIYILNIYASAYNFERAAECLLLLSTAFIPMMITEIVFNIFYHFNNNNMIIHGDSPSSIVSSFSISLMSSIYRLIGLTISIIFISFLYWMLDEYHNSFMSGVFSIDDRAISNDEKEKKDNNRPHYHNYFRILGMSLEYFGYNGLFFIMFGYILISDLILHNPKDGYYVVGEFLFSICRGKTNTTSETRNRLLQHLLECLVRAFYSPLMFISLCDNMPMLFYKGFPDFMAFFRFANNFIFSVDLCFASIGYSAPFSLLLGTQFRSTEPTLLGWVSALMCYQVPFNTFIFNLY